MGNTIYQDDIDHLRATLKKTQAILKKQQRDIHKNCIQCSGEVDAVESCPMKKCPLYKWREGNEKG